MRPIRRRASRAAWLHGRLIAADLADLGIDVDCAPVLDVSVPGTSEAIGDRAFGGDPARVAALGRALAEGLMDGGVLPVMKHLPGQGRATADSHVGLPVVDATRWTCWRPAISRRSPRSPTCRWR